MASPSARALALMRWAVSTSGAAAAVISFLPDLRAYRALQR
jgi:hypothetical protein